MKYILLLLVSCGLSHSENESIMFHLQAKKQGEVCYKIEEPYDTRGIYCLTYMRYK